MPLKITPISILIINSIPISIKKSALVENYSDFNFNNFKKSFADLFYILYIIQSTQKIKEILHETENRKLVLSKQCNLRLYIKCGHYYTNECALKETVS